LLLYGSRSLASFMDGVDFAITENSY